MFYEGIQSEEGKIVEESEAYSYALERSLYGSKEDRQDFQKMLEVQQDFQEMLVEWFYSGDWIKMEDKKNA